MKKHLVLLLLAGGLPFAASAQQATSKQECTRRCTNSDLPGNPQMDRYAKQLERIRAQKKTEADPDKLKALARQEQDVLDRREDRRENICHEICKHNPEE